MNNLPIELVNKIIMMNRPIYPFMSSLKYKLELRRIYTEKLNKIIKRFYTQKYLNLIFLNFLTIN